MAQKKERESLEEKIRILKKGNDDLVKKNTDLVEKNNDRITKNTAMKNELEDRTKQNEITEAKLKRATSVLQKVLEDNGLSEILVNSEIHGKGTHSAIQEELTTGDLKKEIEDQKLIIEEQSVTIKKRGFLLKQS